MKKRTLQINIPLFWKFSLAIIFIVALFGSINAYLIWENVQKALEKESEERVLFIARSLSQQVVTPLLFEDYIGIQKLIDETVKLDSSIKYAFILDASGKVLIHSTNYPIPIALVKANLLKGNDSLRVQLIENLSSQDEIIRDLAYPILGGKLGQIRVGISEQSIYSDVIRTINHFWIMVGFFLVFGILGALAFSHFITKPIKSIQSLADSFDFKSLEGKKVPKIIIREKILDRFPVLFRAKDEIDLLTDKVNDMIFRLSEAYKKLKHTQSQLIQSEKLATIGTISSGLAHEINNPISGLQNCIRRLNKDPQNVEQNKKYLILMDDAVNRIETVIKNLLNYARHEETVFVKVNLEELIENSLLLLDYRLEKNGISVVREIQPNLNKILGSVTHIEQILINLIINAIDAIQQAGSLSKKRISISAENFDNYVKFIIKDDGIGIPSDKLKYIFTPFYTTKAAGKGTGLGLSVIQNIVNLHNGRIEVTSKEKKGSKFIVYLPIYKKA